MIKNNVSLKTYQMFNQLNCKINYIIFLLKCLKFQKQYDGKSETEFNIRLNNHRKNVTRKDSIPASNHFDTGGRKFNINAKFMLTEQLNQTNLDKSTLQKLLKIRGYFWILKLQNLHPKGINREFNKK